MSQTDWNRRIRTVLWAIVRLRCPRCGRGQAFAGWFRMKKACAECGRRFQRPSGSVTGVMQVGAMALVVFAIAAWVLLYHGLGWRRDPALIGVAVASCAFGLWFHPYAKLIWEGVDCLVDEMNKDEQGQ